MADPPLVVVSGPPCSGKTTVGRRIADELGLPFIAKDDIKESLFDTLGTKDREWSKKLGLSSMVLLFRIVAAQLQAGGSVVAEANFHMDFDTPRFDELRSRFELELLQIHCTASAAVLLSRFRGRADSGERHPGHVEDLQLEEILGELRHNLSEGVWDALDIGGQLLTVDTTDFCTVDYEGLLRRIRATRMR